MTSSIGKKEKYSVQGSVSPNQLQSMIMSEQEGDVCVIVFRLIVDRISFKYITKAHLLRKILLQYQQSANKSFLIIQRKRNLLFVSRHIVLLSLSRIILQH